MPAKKDGISGLIELAVLTALDLRQNAASTIREITLKIYDCRWSWGPEKIWSAVLRLHKRGCLSTATGKKTLSRHTRFYISGYQAIKAKAG